MDWPLSGVTVRFYDSTNTLVYEEVTDAAGRVVGMITQSDVVGALFAGEPTG